MHEFSLVRTLLSQVAAIGVAHGGAPVEEIHVEIGPLAGVEPLLVRSAFDQLESVSQVAGARLVIDEVPLESVCEDCGVQFAVEQFRFHCSACGSTCIRVVGGDAMRLISVTLRQPVAANGDA